MALHLLQRLRYSPFFTQLVVIRRCNLSCGYCNEFDKHSAPVPLADLKARVDHLRALGAFAICYTGGEPTLHPDLPALIRYAHHERKFFHTSIISNATYMTRELIERLNDAGLDAVQISIDGVKRNDTTVKVLDSLRKRLDDLKTYAKFKVVISGVVGACPPEESYEVIAYAKRLGFRPRVLLIHGPDGQVKLNEAEMQVYERIKQEIRRHPWDLSDYKHRMITTGEAPFKCRAGSRYLYVDEHGIVAWCSQTRDAFAKPLLDYTYADLREQFYTYKSCHSRCTLGCVRSASAYDGWRPQQGPTAAIDQTQKSAVQPHSVNE